MMTTNKLTPWFPADVKPVHVGVYRVNIGSKREKWFRKWDGCNWLAGSTSIEFSLRSNAHVSPQQWRGLAEKPG